MEPSVRMQGQEPLTASMLAAAPLQEQKQMLGERIYPLIFSMHAKLAGKITGMLLEIDNSELLHMLESPESLQTKTAAIRAGVSTRRTWASAGALSRQGAHSPSGTLARYSAGPREWTPAACPGPRHLRYLPLPVPALQRLPSSDCDVQVRGRDDVTSACPLPEQSQHREQEDAEESRSRAASSNEVEEAVGVLEAHHAKESSHKGGHPSLM
ncbi:unnamed protein product [Ranitomeya imitator]|uniref:PABC domain-containing protein n=1 Tax=Ranitomeya imitator TaxID=111125 RepID=A0ABN9LW36_9NEOB|nr:unnamed protein product [Ranitomeya imitator]